MIFLVLFILIPIIEISLFVTIGGEIGVVWTLLMCLITAFLGAGLIRVQGLGALLSARQRMDRNEIPVKEMFDGLCLAFAGAVLITPGFFTDAIGFSLLIPPFRDFIRHYVVHHMDVKIFNGEKSAPRGGSAGADRKHADNANVIEAEYERIEPDHDTPADKS